MKINTLTEQPLKIKENDFNLNLPRYVDTFEEERGVDIKAVQDRNQPVKESDC